MFTFSDDLLPLLDNSLVDAHVDTFPSGLTVITTLDYNSAIWKLMLINLYLRHETISDEQLRDCLKELDKVSDKFTIIESGELINIPLVFATISRAIRQRDPSEYPYVPPLWLISFGHVYFLIVTFIGLYVAVLYRQISKTFKYPSHSTREGTVLS